MERSPRKEHTGKSWQVQVKAVNGLVRHCSEGEPSWRGQQTPRSDVRVLGDDLDNPAVGAGGELRRHHRGRLHGVLQVRLHLRVRIHHPEPVAVVPAAGKVDNAGRVLALAGRVVLTGNLAEIYPEIVPAASLVVDGEVGGHGGRGRQSGAAARIVQPGPGLGVAPHGIGPRTSCPAATRRRGQFVGRTRPYHRPHGSAGRKVVGAPQGTLKMYQENMSKQQLGSLQTMSTMREKCVIPENLSGF